MMTAGKHYYKHLDKEKHCNVNIELNMEQLAQMVCNANYGLHRFISEVIDIKRESKWKEDKEFADELESLLNKGYF
ncbi:hypothetical protein COE51_01350 [Bacillus pseudomycoides]|nr:hypothetical protein COE51_01350 [Bacillus pseudomycoides]